MSTVTSFVRRLTDPIVRIPQGRFLLILLALLAVVRVGVVVQMGNFKDPFLYESGIIARNIIAGNGYAIDYRMPVPQAYIDPAELATARPMATAYTLPGYVFVVTAALAVFGDGPAGYIALYALNVFITIGTALLLYLLARRLFGERTARFAALLYSVYPPAVALVLTFGSGPWNQFASVLALFALARVLASGRTVDAVLAGLAGGLWLMFRAEALLLAVFFAAWMWRRYSLRTSAVYAAFLLLVVLPWTIRNYATFDTFIPLTTNGWLNIWRGTNPESTGGSFHTNGDPNYFDHAKTLIDEFNAVPVTNRYEPDVMQIYKRHTIEWVTAHPVDALLLHLRKTIMSFTIDTSDARVWQKSFLIPHLLLAAFTVVGFVVLLRRRASMLLLVPVAFYWFVFPFFHIETRHQLMVSALHLLVVAAMLTGERTRTTGADASAAPASGSLT